MTIKEFGPVNASDTDARLREERGDWMDYFLQGKQKEILLDWLFDRIPREDGEYCWEIRLNGLRGFLFACYDQHDGIVIYGFRHRTHRWHRRGVSN